jgi:hypothetical protein
VCPALLGKGDLFPLPQEVQCPGFAFYELYHDQGAGLWVLDKVLD